MAVDYLPPGQQLVFWLVRLVFALAAVTRVKTLTSVIAGVVIDELEARLSAAGVRAVGVVGVVNPIITDTTEVHPSAALT